MMAEIFSKDFEGAVKSLFEMGGYDVKGETLLGHKKIDLYVEDRHLGSTKRIAVECKAHSSALTQQRVSEIYANYLPLYRDNLIDEILIITKQGISPSAEAMCKATRELKHLTFHDLEAVIIDFDPYLRGVIADYEEDGLDAYYVPPVTHTGADLGQVILNWLATDEPRPIAVLGSYGMGKTTLARHLAWKLALQALENRTVRIPILVPLGEISSEQSLSGLLGKLFTSRSIVRNYNFELFMRLNRRGRFAILLDGFDEMKHSLTWEAFRYNLSEINRLVTTRAKVIMLGRPTAFLNDEEHLYALHGLRVYQGRTLRDLDWPDYQELHLQRLSASQMEAFLHFYLRWKAGKNGDRRADLVIETLKRQHDTSNQQLLDLATRPVQLRMLAEILPQVSTSSLGQMTVSMLYSVFIDQIIEREHAKQARRDIGTRERRRFAREIAWWMWLERKGTSLVADEIPKELILPYCDSPKELDARRRDLVLACFLSRKMGGALYFPHRSFQEFLVAEKVIELLSSEGSSYDLVAPIVTEEISFFINNMAGLATLESWDAGLRNFHGTMPWVLAQTWLSDPRYGRWLSQKSQDTSNPWYPLFLTAALCRRIPLNVSPRIFVDQLLRRLQLAPEPAYALLCWFCIFVLSANGEGNAIENATYILLDRRIALGKSRKSKRKRSKRGKDERDQNLAPQSPQTETDIGEFIATLIVDRRKGVLQLWTTYPFLARLFSRYCFLSEWLSDGNLRAKELPLRDSLPLDPDLLALIEARRRGTV